MELNRVEFAEMSSQQIAALMANEKLPSVGEEGEQVYLRGMLQMVLRRKDGSGVYMAQENLITNAGFDLLCDVVGKNAQPGDLTHIGIGTGGAAAAAAQTSLTTQNARGTAAYAHVTGTKIFTMSATFAAGTGTGSVVEAGCFNAANAGTMFNRVVFTAIAKGAADSLAVTFTFTFS